MINKIKTIKAKRKLSATMAISFDSVRSKFLNCNSLEQFEMVLQDVSTKNNLKALLEEIMNSENIVIKNAALSQHHRLGFDKLILISSPYFQLHLHIWWPYRKLLKEGIHNHKFNFVSKIMIGSMMNSIYERSDPEREKSISFHEYLSNPLSTNLYDSFEYKGISSLILKDSKVYKEGEIYHLDNNQFHTGDPTVNKELTVTLFVRTNNIKERDTIFEKVPFSSQVQTTEIIKNEQITSTDYTKLLSTFLDFFLSKGL